MRLILNTYLIHLLNIKCKVTVFLYEQKTYSQLFFSCFILLFEIKQTVVNIALWMYFIVSY